MPMNNTEKNAYAAGPGRNARETAYRIIRDKIIGCELKPGEAISDKQLAEELQMSRTPVREALIILSTSNMVVLKKSSQEPAAGLRRNIDGCTRRISEPISIMRSCREKAEERIFSAWITSFTGSHFSLSAGRKTTAFSLTSSSILSVCVC